MDKKLEKWEDDFDNDPDTGRAFREITLGIAKITGKDENSIKAPFHHREKIKDFIRTALSQARKEVIQDLLAKKGWLDYFSESFEAVTVADILSYATSKGIVIDK